MSEEDIFLNDFNLKYKSNFEATQYRFCFGHNSLIHIDDISKLENKNYLLPEEEINTLFNEIKLGKLSKVEEILKNIDKFISL